MNLFLEFEHINCYNGAPLISIKVNGHEYYNGVVDTYISLSVPDVQHGILTIEHHSKQNIDTEVQNNVIVNDKNFTLKDITIDEYKLEELKWNSSFTTVDGNTIPGCLFFGPNGVYRLEFEQPILKWILQTRHKTNNNDPNWEEDYNYYIRAVNLIQELS